MANKEENKIIMISTYEADKHIVKSVQENEENKKRLKFLKPTPLYLSTSKR